VSAAFFIEQEFQETGYYVYRFYKASFGRQPSFTEFMSDRSQVSGANLEARKQAFADQWVQRPAFVAAYPITMSNTEVVNKLFDSAGLTASMHYLRRDVDQDGYDFWLDVVNNREPNNYHGMVCAFITSREYQLRFGSEVTRRNADCGQ